MHNKPRRRQSKKRGLQWLLPAFIGCCLFAFVQQGWTQTGNEKGNLGAIIQELEKKWTDYKFLYDLEALQTRKVVRKPDIARQSYEEVLNALHKAGFINYRIEGRAISIAVLPAPAPAKRDSSRVIGTIIDEETGQSVAGATVMIGDKGVTTDVDGSFSVTLSKGNYTATISYVGYGTKKVTDIEVADNETFTLNATLKRQKGQLAQVIVSGSARKESVASLYVMQKNRASISDGISTEQITRTPDNNIGQALKRINGVTTVDNKYVIVRGMTERYNQAMIDGIILPSTDMNRRNFSFDVVPAELVSNVVVNKTASAELSAEFSGGQVNVNTIDIPTQDFTQITVGTGFNSNALGKTFIQGGGRGSMDYLSFDDGRRSQPKNIQMWVYTTNSKTPDYAVPQSKLFRSEGMRMYNYKGEPNQNYRVSLGRVIDLNEHLRFGIVAGVNLRNSQEVNQIKTVRNTEVNNSVDSAISGYGNVYKFNSTLGALLNLGLTGKGFRLSFKNLYTHTLQDDLYDMISYIQDIAGGVSRKLVADPESTSLLQNKLEGEHTLSKNGLKFIWSGAITSMHQQILDRRKLRYGSGELNGEPVYLYPNLTSNATTDTDPDYRLWTDLRETDYTWSAAFSQPVTILKEKTLIRLGYMGWYKERALSSMQANTYTNSSQLRMISYNELLSPENMGLGNGQAYYYVSADNGQQYAGVSKYHSAFLMLDQRLFQKFRLVYGVRAENFNLANQQDRYIRQVQRNPNGVWPNPTITGEKNWRFLPSANLTYNLTEKMNLRLAYSITMVRPDFRESAYFGLYDPSLEASISGWNVISTKIYNYDFRYEFYPSPGEIFSVSAFYKYFDKPLELVLWTGSNNSAYRFQNQRSAVNYGVEMEFRKSLGFISDKKWLRNITLFGNGFLIWSEVNAVDYKFENNMTVAHDQPGLKRSLYGQAPYGANAGIIYDAEKYGLNIVYNHTGAKPYILHTNPNNIEYENGRHLVDLQLFARLLKRKLEVKLNVTNLLQDATLYYINYGEYDMVQGVNKGRVNGTDRFERDKGDVVRYQTQAGRNYSLTFSYRF